MEKLEWREVFQRQPAYYLYLDLTAPMSIKILNDFCQVLRDIATLSVSLKGSQRLTTLGLFALSNKIKSIFPLQFVKNNYTKLQFALESLQSSAALFTSMESLDIEQLSESLQTAVQQYETFYQGSVSDKEEWPQLQMVYFSSQPTQKVLKMMKEALTTIELAYVRKVQIVILRSRQVGSPFSSSELKSDTQPHSSDDMFDNEEKESIIRSLLQISEVEANLYQLENIMKGWLHDTSTDSDHLRLSVDKIVLRCDLRECMLNVDALQLPSQFYLFADTNPVPQTVRANPSVKPTYNSKVPVYSLESVAVVRKDGLCESVLFGHPIVAAATRCWKMDWNELERNQQHFVGLVRYLEEKDLVLLAKRQTSKIVTGEKSLPAGFFAFFPAKNTLLIKPVSSQELWLPLGDVEEKDVPSDSDKEIRKCIENLEEREICNPLTLPSGLHSYLGSYISKNKPRPSASFVVPTLSKDNTSLKKKCTVLPVTEVRSRKPSETSFKNDFLTASALYKEKFRHFLE